MQRLLSPLLLSYSALSLNISCSHMRILWMLNFMHRASNYKEKKMKISQRRKHTRQNLRMYDCGLFSCPFWESGEHVSPVIDGGQCTWKKLTWASVSRISIRAYCVDRTDCPCGWSPAPPKVDWYYDRNLHSRSHCHYPVWLLTLNHSVRLPNVTLMWSKASK